MARTQYQINGETWPRPESYPWERITNGNYLSSGLPIYSPYWIHRWRYPALKNTPFMARLYALSGTELTSLVTTPPGDATTAVEYTEAKVLGVSVTPSWDMPRGVEIVFEVFCP